MSARVTLHVWGVPGRHIPTSVFAMARERRPLRQQPGITFGKLLGTANSATFQGTDLHHWAVLACWSSVPAAEAFEDSDVVRRFDRRSVERLRLDLEPLSSKGSWSRARPFGEPQRKPYEGPVAVLTRARVRPSRWREFSRSVPSVSRDLAKAEGLLMSLGIGEAPIGLQGTFSVWRDDDAVNAFAYRAPAHAQVIRQTRERGWFTEELFARFTVVAIQGSYRGFAGPELGTSASA